MLWIGLTGGIATGKSTVTQWLRDQGFKVADADEFAHQVLNEKKSLLIQKFGSGILFHDQSLNRRAIGEVVFKDKLQLQWLENIVHPEVQTKVGQFKAQCEQEGRKFAFYDVPLLFEKNLQKNFDRVLTIACDPELQLQRIKQRNQWSDSEIRSRLSAQLSILEKVKKSDFVIWNNGTLEDLKIKLYELIYTHPTFVSGM